MPDRDYALAPMLVVKYTPAFGEVDYAFQIDNPFGMNDTLQALQKEAGAKGQAVMIQMALVPLETIFGPKSEEDKENENASPKP